MASKALLPDSCNQGCVHGPRVSASTASSHASFGACPCGAGVGRLLESARRMLEPWWTGIWHSRIRPSNFVGNFTPRNRNVGIAMVSSEQVPEISFIAMGRWIQGGWKVRVELFRTDYCDVCAGPLTDGPVLIGRSRCCSIECAIAARSVERDVAMHSGTYLSTPMRLEHAAAYHTRWR